MIALVPDQMLSMTFFMSSSDGDHTNTLLCMHQGTFNHKEAIVVKKVQMNTHLDEVDHLVGLC